MPNELFGSVGFALSADRRRPKTLARRLTIKERKTQAASSLGSRNLTTHAEKFSRRSPVNLRLSRQVDRTARTISETNMG